MSSLRIGRWAGAVLSLALFTFAAVALGAVDREVDPDEGKSWADHHSWGLPSTVRELAAFPKSYRGWIYEKSSAEVKSRILRQHLADALSAHPEFSAEQRSFLQHEIEIYTAAYIAGDTKDPQVCADLVRLFPDLKIRESLTARNLGEFSIARGTFHSRLINLNAVVRSAAVAILGAPAQAQDDGGLEMFPECNCTHWGVWPCPDCAVNKACIENDDSGAPGSGYLCKPQTQTMCATANLDCTGSAIQCTGVCR